MRTLFDEFTKRFLARLVGGGAQVETQATVEAEAQHIDMTSVPTAEGAAWRASLGWLGRMVEQTCLFECYHDVPSLEEWRDCVHKQSAWHQARRREARRLDKEIPPCPQLWVVSAGRPDQVIARYGLVRMRGWPEGFYGWRGVDVGLVVVRELPVQPDTLFLRLLGAGRTLSGALVEGFNHPLLIELGFRELVVALRLNMDDITEEDRAAMENLDEVYARWESATIAKGIEKGFEKGIEKGIQRGIEKGIHQSLLNIYAARFGDVPPAIAEAVARIGDLEALSGLTTRFAVGTRAQIGESLGIV